MNLFQTFNRSHQLHATDRGVRRMSTPDFGCTEGIEQDIRPTTTSVLVIGGAIREDGYSLTRIEHYLALRLVAFSAESLRSSLIRPLFSSVSLAARVRRVFGFASGSGSTSAA